MPLDLTCGGDLADEDPPSAGYRRALRWPKVNSATPRRILVRPSTPPDERTPDVIPRFCVGVRSSPDAFGGRLPRYLLARDGSDGRGPGRE
jgi:hypothetical protein